MNVAEKLSREIERVTILREGHYRAAVARREANPHDAIIALKTMIAAMNRAIEAGHNAAGSGDTGAVIEAVRKLEGFTS